MSGYISEFFGYRAEDRSETALRAVAKKVCPFLKAACVKNLSRAQVPSGVCTIRQKTSGSPSVICCPNRIYADDYAMLHDIAYKAFKQKKQLYAGRIAVAKAKIPSFPYQPASIHFIAYDVISPDACRDGEILPLGIIEEHCTTVYKVQEAFSAVTLPEGNVYRDAIMHSLYAD